MVNKVSRRFEILGLILLLILLQVCLRGFSGFVCQDGRGYLPSLFIRNNNVVASVIPI